MKNEINILIFPGGTEVGMEIYRSLSNSKNINLISASSQVANHAPYIYTKHYYVSDVCTCTWIDEINRIITDESIDFIYPAHAYVVDALSKNREVIKAKILISDDRVLNITRSKSNTYNLFKDKIPVPRIYCKISDVTSFPVFAKPDSSYGSQGTILIDSPESLKSYFGTEDYLVCEYLPGEEYTIDCFSDKSGRLIFCGARTRERIRMGTSMHCESMKGELAEYFAHTATIIAENTGITGPWFFQMKKDSAGVLKLLEIESRIAGTMAYHRVNGINFPLLHIYDLLGYDLKILQNNFNYSLDRALVNRYSHDLEYDTVYIDLDDTIIVNNRINTEVIRFLYQCLNKKKKIKLISKSLAEDKNGYLAYWKIENLFDEVIWLKEEESKADFICKEEKAVFVDDSFSQRAEVAVKLNIPTFDPSMIEILIDERV